MPSNHRTINTTAIVYNISFSFSSFFAFFAANRRDLVLVRDLMPKRTSKFVCFITDFYAFGISDCRIPLQGRASSTSKTLEGGSLKEAGSNALIDGAGAELATEAVAHEVRIAGLASVLYLRLWHASFDQRVMHCGNAMIPQVHITRVKTVPVHFAVKSECQGRVILHITRHLGHSLHLRRP